MSYEAAYYQSQFILKKNTSGFIQNSNLLVVTLYDLAMNLDLNQSYKF